MSVDNSKGSIALYWNAYYILSHFKFSIEEQNSRK